MDREERKERVRSESHAGDRDREMEKETRREEIQRENGLGKREREQGQGLKSECGGEGQSNRKRKPLVRNFWVGQKKSFGFLHNKFFAPTQHEQPQPRCMPWRHTKPFSRINPFPLSVTALERRMPIVPICK